MQESKTIREMSKMGKSRATARMEYVTSIDKVPKKIWQPAKIGEPEPIATLLDGQDLVTPGREGAIPGSEALKILVQNYRPGGSHKPHTHDDCEQVFFCKAGSGQFLLDEEWFDIEEGDVAYVPRHVTHAARNTGASVLTLIFISIPLGRG